MKKRLMPPDESLKEPKMKFEDTFSAEQVVLDHFFRGKDNGRDKA